MSTYKNLNGNSGISSYESGTSSIIVQFKDGSAYLYNDQYTGGNNIITMKQLANSGSGLNSFINTHVKKRYAKKLR